MLFDDLNVVIKVVEFRNIIVVVIYLNMCIVIVSVVVKCVE